MAGNDSALALAEFDPPQEGYIIPPTRVSLPGLQTAFEEKRRFSVSVFAIHLTNCTLLGGTNSLCHQDRLYARQFEHNPAELVHVNWRATASVGPSVHATVEESQLCSSPVLIVGSSTNYYHWLIDHLARVAVARHLLSGGRRLLVPDALTVWQRDSLRRLGVEDSQTVPYQYGSNIALRDALAVSNPARYGYVLPKAIQALREHIGCSSDAGSNRRRVFLWRAPDGHRAIAGQHELAGALEAVGFDVVDPLQLSFDEQVAALSCAGVIVGCHGAALANMVWASPGTTVIEVVSPGYQAPYYELLARACGHAYSFVMAEDAVVEDDSIAPFRRGMSIPQTAVTALLARLQ